MAKNIFKAAGWLLLINSCVKVLGFVREMVIADGFGASAFTDAYLETLTQSGTKSMTLTIPSEINGVSVKGIGAKAFQDLRFLTGVLQLPNTITDIGAGAFSGTGFSTVYLPKSLASCGASAFDGGSVLIFANQDSYDRFAGTGITPDPSRTGYQFTLRLKNADGTETKRKALFSFPLNWEKNAQGVWAENPAWKLPAIPGGDGYSDATQAMLPKIDVFIGSEFYYNKLFGSSENYRENLLSLQRLGVKIVVFTLGEKGSVALWKGGYRFCPGYRVEVVDTLGAGDVYHGGYLFALLEGMDPGECAQFANAVAAIKCMGIGGRANTPNYEMTRQFMETGDFDRSLVQQKTEFYSNFSVK